MSKSEMTHACGHAVRKPPSGEQCVMKAIDESALRNRPYRHLIVDRIFDEAAFSLMAAHVREISARSGASVFKERDYGASIFGINSENLGPLSNLVNLDIIQRIATRLDVPVTSYVDAAIHVHPPGSPSGWLHTDFNIGWFSQRSSSGPHFSEQAICDYRTGRLGASAGKAVELTRSIAMILYFNDEWKELHGGETVICRSEKDPVDDAPIRVAPLANRLLAFECSPISFHSFAATQRERISLIFWAHADAIQLSDRWPLSLRSGWK